MSPKEKAPPSINRTESLLSLKMPPWQIMAVASLVVSAAVSDIPEAVQAVGDEVVDEFSELVLRRDDQHRLDIDMDTSLRPWPHLKVHVHGERDAQPDDISESAGNVHEWGIPKFDIEISEGKTITVEIPAEVQRNSRDVHMEWAEFFAQDANAEKISSQSELSTAIKMIAVLNSSDCKPVSIDVQGFASMEDNNTANDNPGFGIDSENNIKLANVRASAVGDIVQAVVSEDLGRPLEVTQYDGLEIDRIDLAEEIHGLAESQGLSTVELVQTYNRSPDTLSSDVIKIMDQLKDDRFVRVTVTCEIPASSEQITLPPHIEVRLNRPAPVDADAVTESEPGHEESGDIYLVPVVFLIPVVAGRIWRPGKGPSPVTPIPATPETLVPPVPPLKRRKLDKPGRIRQRVKPPVVGEPIFKTLENKHKLRFNDDRSRMPVNSHTNDVFYPHKQPLPQNYHGARRGNTFDKRKPQALSRKGR